MLGVSDAGAGAAGAATAGVVGTSSAPVVCFVAAGLRGVALTASFFGAAFFAGADVAPFPMAGVDVASLPGFAAEAAADGFGTALAPLAPSDFLAALFAAGWDLLTLLAATAFAGLTLDTSWLDTARDRPFVTPAVAGGVLAA